MNLQDLMHLSNDAKRQLILTLDDQPAMLIVIPQETVPTRTRISTGAKDYSCYPDYLAACEYMLEPPLNYDDWLFQKRY